MHGGSPQTNAQYEVLRSFITPDVLQLVRARLLRGERLFDGHQRIHSYEVTKLALLLIQMANPQEYFTEDERNVLLKLPRGVDADEGDPKPRQPQIEGADQQIKNTERQNERTAKKRKKQE
jgi:hypothetical protein